MKPLIKLTLVLLAVNALAGCGSFTNGKPAADRAIAEFHELYNQGKLEQIWTDADPQFRSVSSKQKHEELFGAVQRKLGKVTSSSNLSWNTKTFNFKTTVYMVQQTIFENGQGTEYFTFGINGTNAVLLGYNIQSTDLITK